MIINPSNLPTTTLQAPDIDRHVAALSQAMPDILRGQIATALAANRMSDVKRLIIRYVLLQISKGA